MEDQVERALRASSAEGCVAVGSLGTHVNLRWANNTSTTNGFVEDTGLSVAAIGNGTSGSASANLWSPDRVEAIVREAEASCASRPPAQDYAPLPSGDGREGWDEGYERTDPSVLAGFADALSGILRKADGAGIRLFGYAQHGSWATRLGTSAGVRRGHRRARGSVGITAKSDDFTRSAWAGCDTPDFTDVDLDALYAKLEQRLDWSRTPIALEPGRYEVILEPQAVADMLMYVVFSMTAREADEGRSAFSKPGGGNRIGERLGAEDITMYSDPREPGMETAPFVATTSSGSFSSVFDAGLDTSRVTWLDNGVLRALVTPRWWAAKTGGTPTPYPGNLILSAPERAASVDDMIAATERALLVTRFWYIRLVDPQTLLLTGLTRDGIFLVQDGRVTGAVNNFRFNESPVAMLANTVEAGPAKQVSGQMKVPALRVRDFHMSSVSEAV